MNLEKDITAAFTDKDFKKFCLEKFDKNNDGKLQVKDVSKIKKLDVSNQGIVSLQGIEYFTALRILHCFGNQIKTMDVSNNTALTELACGVNELEELDVSKQSGLQILYCHYNQLKTLDITKNTRLIKLHCNNNLLQTLDISQNPDLQYLECSYNQLTALDVRHNPAMYRLTLGYNQLTELDVTNNPNLYDLNLTQNAIEKNIDFSQNINLGHLLFYKNKKSKKTTSPYVLDLRNCTKLSVLRCWDNPYISEVWVSRKPEDLDTGTAKITIK
jgi:hypothetical protein